MQGQQRWRLMVALGLLLLPQAASATWLRAESPAFIGYSRGSEATLRRQLVELQKFDQLAQLLTGVKVAPDRPRLPVYFVTGRDLRTFGFDNPDIGGFYRATPGAITAALAIDRAGGGYSASVLAVLFHEYTHHFMFQNSHGVYPAWYVEGFAEYLMTATFRDDAITFGEPDAGRARQLVGANWMPMRKVLSVRGTDLRRADLAAFYAQSWLAVHFLSRQSEKPGSLKAYLKAFGSGMAPETAFSQAFGMDYDAFDKRLRAYLQSSKLTMSRIKGLPPVTADAITVTALPSSADPLLVPATQLASLPIDPPRPLDAGATRLLADIRTAAARFPGDGYAQAVRAEAEIKLGDRAAGTALLDRLLAASPDDPQLLYLGGLVALAGADGATGMAKARKLLTRANKSRPDDYRILAAHARTYPAGALPDREVDVVLRAAELAPQVADVQAQAAIVLAARGRRAEARALLAPIANNPHGGPEAAAAAALMAALDRGEAATPDAR